MRLALPSASSKLHASAREAVWPVGAATAPRAVPPRTLFVPAGDGGEVVYCRGRDVPELVGAGVADAGLTGYDVAVEWMLRSGTMLDVRLWVPSRLSFVAFVTVPGRRITRIYTEYPEITRRWVRSSTQRRGVSLVPLAGSSEGAIRADPQAGGVVLVTTGATLRANALQVSVPLLATDLCVVRRRGERACVRVASVSPDALPAVGLPSFCQEVDAASPGDVAQHVGDP